MEKIFKDQMNRTIRLRNNPGRIISLVPSQTELLVDLGLEEQLVGITRFCIHPDHIFRTKTRIGGTKNIKPEIIRSLHPDLIIGNKEENEKSQIEEIENEFPVWMSNIKNLDDAYEMIHSIGEITGTGTKAEKIINKIKSNFSKITPANKLLKTVYFIWRDPWMVAGPDTFINEMMKIAGFENLIQSGTYPELSSEQIKNLNPDIILLSSEPYPFKDLHIEELRKISPGSKIMLVDGELFSWYGSRLIESPEYFIQVRQLSAST